MSKNSQIKERFLQFIEIKGIDEEKIFNDLGFSKWNFVGKSKESELGGDKIAKIIQFFPEISPDWLITGNGTMFRNDTKNMNANKKMIINKLIEYYSDGSSSQFAKKLGVKPQTVSTWGSRNTFDIELIFAKCEDVNPLFLLTGKGDVVLKKCKNDSNVESISERTEELNFENEICKTSQRKEKLTLMNKRVIECAEMLVNNGYVSSIAQLAVECDKSKQYFSDLRKERQKVSLSFIDKLCELYPVNKEYIMFGKSEMLTIPNKETDKKEVNTLLSESITLSKEIVETLIVRLSETLNAQQETINSQQETINTLIGEIKKGGVRQDDNVSCADAG